MIDFRMAPIKNIQRILPYPARSTLTVRQCICDTALCKTLASKFRELGDIQGIYITVPGIAKNT
jgi:hypothetical protein